MKEKLLQKKYLIVIFSIVILVGVIITANKMLNNNVVYAGELSDISEHWAKEDIEFMQSKGGVSGYPDGTFKPNNNVTTGEAIKLVIANFDKTIINGDVHWASNYLEFAKENNIVNENQYTIDSLNNYITRKEVMYMVINSLDKLAYKPIITNSQINVEFNDVSISVNENGIGYYDAIKKCYLLGIVIGDQNKNMNPNANITRAELVTILTRAYNEGRRQYDLEYRSDNMPSNKSEYGLILNIMPNKFYEEYSQYKSGYEPYEYANEKYYDFSEEAIRSSKTKIETALSALINVSYEMSDEEWDAWIAGMLNFSDTSLNDIYDEETSKSNFEEYIKYVKDNKIIIKGGIIIDPTTFGKIKIGEVKYDLAIKGMLKLKILSNPNNIKKLTYSDYINKTTSIYGKEDCNYILLNVIEEDVEGILNNVCFLLNSVHLVKEG